MASAVCDGHLADSDRLSGYADAAGRSRAVAAANRLEVWPDQEPVTVRALSEALPARAWRRVAWRNAPILRGPRTSSRNA